MKYCGEQGCKTLIEKGNYCADHKRKQKKVVWQSNNKSFYQSKAWADTRAYCYQRDRGLCQKCRKFVFGKSAHAHHIVPIYEDSSLKLNIGNIIILCSSCHPIVEAETLQKYKPKKKKFEWKL